MFALRPILPREELTYNYRVEWYGNWRSGQKCECGAPSCTGAFAAPEKGIKELAGRKRRARTAARGGGRWERRLLVESLLSAPCEVCTSSGNHADTLLCDGCDQSYHLYCLSPPLRAVPRGDWFCPMCTAKAHSLEQAAVDKARRAALVDMPLPVPEDRPLGAQTGRSSGRTHPAPPAEPEARPHQRRLRNGKVATTNFVE